jgi:hypothetical protein
VRQARDEWKAHRQPRMRENSHRLVFLDETGTTTKMTRLRGRAPSGTRLKADAPFGHWTTQTFIAGLRCDGLTAPWVIDHPMNRETFDTYVETQLAPTLRKGDVVILDNLASHKSAKAEAILRQRGAWFLFLPPYSPISTRSKWPSPNSRHIFAVSPHAPSMPYGRPSVTSALSTPSKSAGTSSSTRDMRPINRSTL